MAVIVVDEVLDAGDEVADAAEVSAANRLLCNQPEPAFDLIEPRSICGRVVDVEAGPLREPEAYLGMLVGGIVVDDQMDIEVCGHSLVDALEKAEELLMPTPRLALGEDRSSGDIQRSKQGRGAMANVVVRDPFHIAQAHGQYRLGAAECLNLRLLVYPSTMA